MFVVIYLTKHFFKIGNTISLMQLLQLLLLRVCSGGIIARLIDLGVIELQIIERFLLGIIEETGGSEQITLILFMMRY